MEEKGYLQTKLLYWDQRSDREDQVVDELIRGLCIEQSSYHLRRFRRVDLLNIALNIPHHIVAEEVVCEVTHHVVSVTDIDQRPASRFKLIFF